MIKVLRKPCRVLKIYAVKQLHVLKQYLNSFRFVLIRETVILSIEDTEETLIHELRT